MLNRPAFLREAHFKRNQQTASYRSSEHYPQSFTRREFSQVSAAIALQFLIAKANFVRDQRTQLLQKDSKVEKNLQVKELHRLPIEKHREEILRNIENNIISIVIAETGAGKSSQIPQYAARAGYKVDITQPRRFVTESLTNYVRNQFDSNNPEKVNFKHAKSLTPVPDASKILFLTDGYKVQQLVNEVARNNRSIQKVPNFNEVRKLLIVDEVHEMGIPIEVLLALKKLELAEALKRGDTPEKLCITSATMNPEEIINYFKPVVGDVPIVRAKGRMFPVETLELQERDPVEWVATEVLNNKEISIMIILPGKGDIKRFKEALEQKNLDAVILPLHSKMPYEEQALVHKKYGKAKVILATNVALSSITIDDLDVVGTIGYCRRKEFKNGVPLLTYELISQYEYEQAHGRVGRTKLGRFVNFGPKKEELPNVQKYPILNDSLEDITLRLLSGGLNIRKLEFLHQPATETIDRAFESLKALDLVSHSENLTKLGRETVKLPFDVRIAKMLALASKQSDANILYAAIDLVGIMEAEGVYSDVPSNVIYKLLKGQSDKVYESDFFVHLAVFNKVLSWQTQDEALRNKLYEKYKIEKKSIATILENRKVIAQRLNIESLQPNYYVSLNSNQYDILRDIICESFSDMKFSMAKAGDNGKIYYRSNNRKGKGYRNLSKDSLIGPSDFLICNPIDIMNLDENGEVKISSLLSFATVPSESWLSKTKDKIVKLNKPPKGRMNGRNLPNGRGRIG